MFSDKDNSILEMLTDFDEIDDDIWSNLIKIHGIFKRTVFHLREYSEIDHYTRRPVYVLKPSMYVPIIYEMYRNPAKHREFSLIRQDDIEESRRQGKTWQNSPCFSKAVLKFYPNGPFVISIPSLYNDILKTLKDEWGLVINTRKIYEHERENVEYGLEVNDPEIVERAIKKLSYKAKEAKRALGI